jgi:hypothetical protein
LKAFHQLIYLIFVKMHLFIGNSSASIPVQ